MDRPDAGSVMASLARHDPASASSSVPGNTWVAATSAQARLLQAAGPVPVWEQGEEQRRGW
jgi:hypothetical protein